MQHFKTKRPFSADKIKAPLEAVPGKKRTWFMDAMALIEWSDAMFKGAYPPQARRPAYDPMTVVPFC